MEKVPMTAEGYRVLDDQLKQLKSVERPSVISAISEAREHGDLSENAEYHAAKERQGMVEGRILALKDKLGRAEIIDCSTVRTDRVVFGTVITLFDVLTESEVTYQLLGPEEVDVKNGTISFLSPLGKALLGKEEDDQVMVKTPGGMREYEVIRISSTPTP